MGQAQRKNGSTAILKTGRFDNIDQPLMMTAEIAVAAQMNLQIAAQMLRT